MKKKIIIDPSDDDFGALCNCAVRYCLGRRSYMPKLIVDYITSLLSKLNERTLDCFKRDIDERVRIGSDLGDSCDCIVWQQFYKDVCAELKKKEGFGKDYQNEDSN